MTQPPYPPQQPNDPQQGGYGAPAPPPQGGYGYPGATPPPPGQPPQTPPPPPAPPAGAGQQGYGRQGPGQQGYGQQDQAGVAQQPTVFAQPGVQQPGPPGPPGPPPGAPAQQPGYGYPGQQPGYGYPGQPPTTPMSPVAGGGARKFNPQMVIIVAAVVAIALIVGGGVWYAKSGSDGGKKDETASSGGTSGKGGGEGGGGGKEKVPSNPNAKLSLQVRAPKVTDDGVVSIKGSWLHGKVYAKAGLRNISGYSTDDGHKLWTAKLAGETCAGAPEVSADGIAAVLFKESKDKYAQCTEVSAFDMTTGKLLWTKSAGSSDDKPAFDEASISGNTVAVGGGTDGGAAFDLKSGKVLWSPKTGECEDRGYAGGEQLVAVQSCGAYDHPKLTVQLLDPASGKPKWSYKVTDGVEDVKVISTKPVVIGMDPGSLDNMTNTGTGDVFSLDDATGKLRAHITLEDDKYSSDCAATEVHGCKGIVVADDKLYVPTAQHSGSGDSYGRTNEIISFSLDTGKTTGERFDAGENGELFPLRTDGKNVIAFRDAGYDKSAEILSLNGATQKATKLLSLPAGGASTKLLIALNPTRSETLYAGGKLFLGEELISKSSFSEGKIQHAAIGYFAGG